MAEGKKGAKDGGVDTRSDAEKADDLARKRAEREQKSDPTAPDGNGSSIEERAENGDASEEEDDGQFTFEVPTPSGGRKITLGTFVPRGTPTEYRVKMKGLSQKGVGGLLDPTETSILLLADCVVEAATPRFTRDAHGKIEKCIITIEVTPRLFVDARTEQAGVMLHGEPATSAAGG
jgi:hypothetical protein